MPEGEEQIREIVAGAIEARGTVGFFSVLALLWSGSRVFGIVAMALNIVYDVDEQYSLVKRTLVEMLMLLTIGLLFILALGSRFLLDLAWRTFELIPLETGMLYDIVLTVIPVLLLFFAFFLTYRFVPRRRPNWVPALIGAVFAALAVTVARPLFITYIQRFAEFNLIYGPLAIVIILIIWAFLIALFLILGGELVAHIHEIWVEGKSPEEVEDRHLERSPGKAGERRERELKLREAREEYSQDGRQREQLEHR